MAIESEKKFMLAVETVATHEDGGEVADLLGVITNVGPEEAIDVLKGVYDFKNGSFSRTIKGEKSRRNKAHFGYTGNWGTAWNPHAIDNQVPRGPDGKITYQ